ncbi:MAG TPA: zinc ribbon domain-containing protein [Phycisphaerae bacterium]|nr:zinc ribbon domain-containing protein [Phycisphaerae bacterium]
MTVQKTHPHDVGLPEPVVRRRRKSRRVAQLMLIIAILTAIPGWSLLGTSIFSAIKIQDQSPALAIVAYALLIISSITLVLGLWYLLLAQVERVARMVESDEDPGAPLRCQNCGWNHDPPDRFCRHCGKPLGATISPPVAHPPAGGQR